MKLGWCFGNVSVLLLCFFLIDESVAQDCGHVTPRKKIYTLDAEFMNVKQGAFPWMVAISMRDRYRKYHVQCSGVLITKRHVLSVAHCFDRKDPSLYLAKIGNVNLNLALDFNISQIKIPDTYKSGRYYGDLSVLTLSKDVNTDIDTNQRSCTVCLPTSFEFTDLNGKLATAVGWKRAEPGDTPSYPPIEIPGIPIISNQRCNATFSRLPSFPRQFPTGVDDGIICAGSLERIGDETCAIYSGSPLMYQQENRWHVVGLTSFGLSCNHNGFPGGYTRVSTYLNWILQNIEI